MTIESDGVGIIFDAGSGLMLLDKALREVASEWQEQPKMHVLISHLHLDHIIGFGTFSAAWRKDCGMEVYTCTRDDRPLKEQVLGVFKPPYWPESLVALSGAKCIPIEDGVPFNIEHFTITPFAATHPDITLSFHVTDGTKTFVHLLDNEVAIMNEREYARLVELCSGADLVVFDAAYSTEDYPSLRGWGHSTVEQGIELARLSKPKRMMFCHFGQQYSDDEIDSWARYFEDETWCEFILGCDGDVRDI
jgi:ribonuclease BN (tRNA processing enzyme)